MAKPKDPMESSFQPEAVAGAGRGALIISCAGAGWLGWGLGEANAFNAVVGPAFGCMTLFLWVWSIYTIRKDRLLRKQYPLVPASTRRAVRSLASGSGANRIVSSRYASRHQAIKFGPRYA